MRRTLLCPTHRRGYHPFDTLILHIPKSSMPSSHNPHTKCTCGKSKKPSKLNCQGQIPGIPRTRYYDIDTGKNTPTYSRFKVPTSLGHSCQEPSVPCPVDALLRRGCESNWSFAVQCNATSGEKQWKTELVSRCLKNKSMIINACGRKLGFIIGWWFVEGFFVFVLGLFFVFGLLLVFLHFPVVFLHCPLIFLHFPFSISVPSFSISFPSFSISFSSCSISCLSFSNSFPLFFFWSSRLLSFIFHWFSRFLSFFPLLSSILSFILVFSFHFYVFYPLIYGFHRRFSAFSVCSSSITLWCFWCSVSFEHFFPLFPSAPVLLLYLSTYLCTYLCIYLPTYLST